MKTEFIGNDLEVMRSLKYDPTLKPNYESIRGCLFWKDERSEELSPDGYKLVNSLIIARSLLQQGLTLDDHPIDPEYCKKLWAIAQKQIADWPGFKRVTLSAEDKEYFEDQIARAEREDL